MGNQNSVCGFVGFAVLTGLVIRVVWGIVGASDGYVYASIKLRWRSRSTPEPTFSFHLEVKMLELKIIVWNLIAVPLLMLIGWIMA